MKQTLKDLKWFEDRIGRRIYRDSERYGFRIKDAKHAVYLFHIQNKLNFEYND